MKQYPDEASVQHVLAGIPEAEAYVDVAPAVAALRNAGIKASCFLDNLDWKTIENWKTPVSSLEGAKHRERQTDRLARPMDSISLIHDHGPHLDPDRRTRPQALTRRSLCCCMWAQLPKRVRDDWYGPCREDP